MARYIDIDKIDFSLIKDPAIRIMVKRFILNKPTEDVVPKSEVYGFTAEELAQKCERLSIELEAMRTSANAYKMHYENAKQEVAREIFEDIRKTCGYSVAEHDGVVLYHTKCYSIMATKLDELEKKYTESES